MLFNDRCHPAHLQLGVFQRVVVGLSWPELGFWIEQPCERAEAAILPIRPDIESSEVLAEAVDDGVVEPNTVAPDPVSLLGN